jgi:DNA-binding MarR family transcriptional regulator
MNTDNTINLISVVRKETNEFLLNEMKKIGFEDLSPSHGSILAALFKYNEATMTEIANLIRRDRSTVTVLVNKLIRLGYIACKKNLNDSRSNIIYLTEKGRRFEEDFKKISVELYEIAYKNVTEYEKEIFKKVLNKIYKNFRHSTSNCD